MSKSKKNFEEYQELMKQKFDIEDKMVKIENEKWRLNNENIKHGQQLRLIEDQIRNMFNRVRIELKKNKEEKQE